MEEENSTRPMKNDGIRQNYDKNDGTQGWKVHNTRINAKQAHRSVTYTKCRRVWKCRLRDGANVEHATATVDHETEQV
eukprot:2652262-Amphidinium_carterae.1